ncbi:CBS domain-containing protein [Geoglobus acetivorans]
MELPVMLRVRDVMNEDVTKVEKNEDVLSAMNKMIEKGVKCAVVVDDSGKEIGLITEGTVVRKVLMDRKDPAEVRVGEIMSTPLKTIPADMSLRDAMIKFVSDNVKQLYVEDNGKIVGIITEHRILKALTEIIVTLLSI